MAGYDLTVLPDGRIVLTSIVYEKQGESDREKDAQDELAYELSVSANDGQTWDTARSIRIYDPQRRILGRGWPRTVLLDKETLGTVFFDLDPQQAGGPGLFFVRTPLAAFTTE